MTKYLPFVAGVEDDFPPLPGGVAGVDVTVNFGPEFCPLELDAFPDFFVASRDIYIFVKKVL